jgi:hypothetical protein
MPTSYAAAIPSCGLLWVEGRKPPLEFAEVVKPQLVRKEDDKRSSAWFA